MKRKQLAAMVALCILGGAGGEVHAAFDENLAEYTLDTVIVEADRAKTKFGDTITEQSYYRTGGDVKVITREEIENVGLTRYFLLALSWVLMYTVFRRVNVD